MSKDKKKRDAKKDLQDKENLASLPKQDAQVASSDELLVHEDDAPMSEVTPVSPTEPEKEEAAPTPAPTPAEERSAPEPQQIVLQDAARRMVVGWKDHWFQGLAKFAKNKGFTGSGSQEDCRKILMAWGAKLK